MDTRKVVFTAATSLIYAVFLALNIIDWSDAIHAASFFVSVTAFVVMLWNFFTFIDKIQRDEIQGVVFPSV